MNLMLVMECYQKMCTVLQKKRDTTFDYVFSRCRRIFKIISRVPKESTETSTAVLHQLPNEFSDLTCKMPWNYYYCHYVGQLALAGTPVKKWRILLEQSFTVRMPLLMATSAFRLGRL